MAAVNVTGVNYTQFLTNKMGTDQGKIFTGLKVWSDSYEASAVDADSTIMAKLPAGAVVQGMVLAFDDLGTGVTVDVGDSNNVDRYFDGVDVATAAGTSTSILVDGLGYVIGTNSGDDVILITILGAAATGTVKLSVYYS